MAISQLNNSEKNGQYDSKDKEDMEYIKNGVGEIPFKPAQKCEYLVVISVYIHRTVSQAWKNCNKKGILSCFPLAVYISYLRYSEYRP